MTTLALRRPAVLSRPNWVKLSFAGVLVLAAALCLWNLTISGYSNEYYAAATRAGAESWKAWFFGAIDPGSFITVDKPPLSLWLSGLSARVLGFSSFSVLLPQALCTIAAVGALFATVRRIAGDASALIAALAFALSPIAIAVARVNNPDALLVLLLVLSAYFTVRALESGRTKHLVIAGALVGLAFMTKMLQGWMIVPALAVAYVGFAPVPVWTRVRQLLIAGAAMVLVSVAWPLAVSLWPGAKPYIGGSTDGSVWDLILGYNGFGRIFGEGGGMGGGGGPTFGGAAGWLRMFNEQVGAQIAWLLPLAGVSFAYGAWKTRGIARAGFVLFGVWALVHVAVFSSQQGIFHPYYVSALAPAVAALVGMGVTRLPRGVLAVSVVATAWLAVELLNRTPDFAPWLRVAIPIAAAVAALALLAKQRWIAIAATGVALLAGPGSYAVANVGHSLNGNNVLAGPSDVSRGAFGGGGPGGGFGGGQPPSGVAPGGGAGMAGGPPGGGGFGGRANVSTDMLAYLEAHQGSAKYLVAANGSQTTAPIIIQTGKAVVTIGGFSGRDNAPTVEQFASMVAKGEVEYALASGDGTIDQWVQQHGTAVDGYDGLYRLTAA
ncbi:ArnT family glycosyltransferase [Solirubrobacter soli]|uniref:ArnT family glycosyltransferase n=1 Tax=Solirubrobacter soli TaxID=363832 RepID=UPI000417921B|nr:glycosyltransferase family 39 protein [Solirubrobacter soli]